MQVWKVLHAARCKCRTQKRRQKSARHYSSGRQPNCGVQQRRATYIRQGGHHVGHWPTFLVCVISANSGSFRAHCVKVNVRYLISSWVLVFTDDWRRHIYSSHTEKPTERPTVRTSIDQDERCRDKTHLYTINVKSQMASAVGESQVVDITPV